MAELLLLIPVLLFSLSFHEYSHGRVADILGDPTPREAGRITLNPLAHLDLMGSLVLIMTRRFGWAKPVPVNPTYFHNPRQGMMLVGLAGPLSNLLLAFLFSLFFRFFRTPSFLSWLYGLGGNSLIIIVRDFLSLALIVNVALALFNLIPVPPLDGSRILQGVLPRRYDGFFHQLEGYGMFIIFFLALSGILGRVISPLLNFTIHFLFGL